MKIEKLKLRKKKTKHPFPNQQKLNHLRKWYMNAEIRF
jgi:hypothetical protein